MFCFIYFSFSKYVEYFHLLVHLRAYERLSKSLIFYAIGA